MARRAIVAECGLYVIRIDSRADIRLVTGNAGARSIRITRGMTRYAGRRCMRARQRKTRQAMIEVTRLPRRG